MATISWLGVNGNWSEASKWNGNAVPGAADNAVLDTGAGYTVNITAAITPVLSINISDGNATLWIHGVNSGLTSGDLSNSGTFYIDVGGGEGGSNVSIGGLLTNSNSLSIGNGSSSGSTTVSAHALTNTGTINMGSNGANHATLNIASAAGFGSAGVLAGRVNLGGNALLKFASGQIASIAGNSELTLSGTSAFLADAADTTHNSALAGLSTISGDLYLRSVGAFGVTGNLAVGGGLHVDEGGGEGGTTVTVANTLSISGFADIGNGSSSGSTTVNAHALINTGTINIGSNGANHATLNIASAAGFGSAGVLAGRVNLGQNALLKFASGQIVSIAGNSELTLSGTSAFLADAADTTHNSALTGLNTISGDLYLRSIGAFGVTGNLAVGGGLHVDEGGGEGGTTLTIANTLNISGFANIGNGSSSGSTTVNAHALINTGTINMGSNDTFHTNVATLNIASAAGFGAAGVLAGRVNLGQNALLKFTSGQIASIAGNSELTLAGTSAFLADAADTAHNSALTGLNTVSGDLYLRSIGAFGVTGNLAVGGGLHVDEGGGEGGTTLTIANTLNISGFANIGNGSSSGSTTVNAHALTNLGTINMGSNDTFHTNVATLNIASAAGFGSAGVLTGHVNLGQNALLKFASGQIATIAGNSELTLAGTSAFLADAADTTHNSALAGLNTVSGDLYLRSIGAFGVTGNLAVGGGLHVDEGGGEGGTTLTVANTLSISGFANIGNGNSSGSTTVNAHALTNAGTINIGSNDTLHQFTAKLAVSGVATNTGTVNLGTGGEIDVTGGTDYVQSAGRTNVAGVIAGLVDVTGGTLDGTGTITGAVHNDVLGTILGGASADSLGTLTVQGDYEQSGTGLLQVDLQNQSSSLINVTGNVALNGGSLDVHALNTQALTPGQTFTVMTFTPGKLTGQFTAITDGTTTSPGDTLHTNNGFILHVVYDNAAGHIQLDVSSDPFFNFNKAGERLATDLANGAGASTIQADADNLKTEAVTAANAALNGSSDPGAVKAHDDLIAAATLLDNAVTNGGSKKDILADSLNVLMLSTATPIGAVAGDNGERGFAKFMAVTGQLIDAVNSGATTQHIYDLGQSALAQILGPAGSPEWQQFTAFGTAAMNEAKPLIDQGGSVAKQALTDLSGKLMGELVSIASGFSPQAYDNIKSALDTLTVSSGPDAQDIPGAVGKLFDGLYANNVDGFHISPEQAGDLFATAVPGLAQSLFLDPFVAGTAALFAPELVPVLGAIGLGMTAYSLIGLAAQTGLLGPQVENWWNHNATPGALYDHFFGHHHGDVHLTTYDGLYYDFQAAGEFILTQSTWPGDSFSVQVRLEPWFNSTSVTVQTQIAAKVGNDRVTFDLNRPDLVWLDGAPANISQSHPLVLNAGEVIQLANDQYQIDWFTGEVLTVTNYGSYLSGDAGIPTDAPAGSYKGLLGVNGGGTANDLQLANGTVLSQPLSSSVLYGQYADSWRITQAASLFDYGAGQTTATFTDKNFPAGVVSLSNLPQVVVSQATEAATAAGVTDPNVASGAILDFIATGDTSFLTEAQKQTLPGTTTQANINASAPQVSAGISAEHASVHESNGATTSVTFDVYLTGTAAANITINYSVIAPSDGYFDAAAFGGTLPSGHVTIAAGQTMGQVTLQLNNSNLQPELGSNVAVQITPPNGVPVFAATAQTAIIGSVPMTIGDNTANLLFPTAQTEIIQGRGATDTVLFNAPHTDYTIANPASGVTVTGADGVHTLLSIESVKFTDWNVAITTANAYTMPTDVNEVVFHGTGHFAGTGNGLANTIVGGQGADTLNGGGGIDSLNGGSGDDTMFGGAGKDTLIGGDGNDTLVGNDSGPGVFLHEANTLTGGNGNDTLIGEVSDTVSGGAGLDTLQAENANPWTINLGATSIETMLAGFGDDHVDASTQTAGVTVFASGGNDTVTGSGFNDFLWGGVGNDTLTGGSGNDLLFGDLGADSLSGGAGNDTLYGDNSDTHIDGGAGTDALYWAAGANANINVGADAVEFVQTLGNNDTLNGATATANLVLFAGAGNDTVTGGSGNDFLWGEAGNDVLVGNGGNDTIVGGTGADKLTGGAGTDNLFGGNGSNTGDGAADTFVFTAGWGTDFVYGFDDGIDKLDMTASGATQFSQLAVTSSNGNADVDFGTNHIIVVGQAGHIAAGDFIFAP